MNKSNNDVYYEDEGEMYYPDEGEVYPEEGEVFNPNSKESLSFPLMRACNLGDVQEVKRLLDGGADIYQKDKYGDYAFQWINSNEAEIRKLFRDHPKWIQNKS